MTYPTDYMPCPDLHAFDSRRKARKFARRACGEEPPDMGGGEGATLTRRGPDGETVLLVVVEPRDGAGAAQRAALLAHECVHAALSWADVMAEERPGEEWLAYAVQSCMLTCLDQLGEDYITGKEI